MKWVKTWQGYEIVYIGHTLSSLVYYWLAHIDVDSWYMTYGLAWFEA